jgi:hypothetical protein
VFAGRTPPRDADVAALRRCVGPTREWVEHDGRFAEEKRKRKLLELCDQALARLAPGQGGPP